MLFVTYSCKGNETSKDTQKNVVVENGNVVKNDEKQQIKKENKNYSEEYTKFLATLDLKDIKSISKALNYLSETLKGVDVVFIDECFVKFNEFHQKVLPNINQIFIKTPNENQSRVYDVFLNNNPENLKKVTKEQKEYAELLKTNGFKADATPENYFIAIDENIISDKVKNIVSPVMKEYLIQLEKERKEYYLNEGQCLMVSPIVIAERIVFWENFLIKNTKFLYTNKINELLKNYKEVLVEGYGLSTVVESETKTMSGDFQYAYEFMAKNHNSTEFGKFIKECYKIWEKNNFKDNKEVFDYIYKNKPKY